MMFDHAEFMSQLMQYLTPNELNNIIYMEMKYALNVENPDNADIAQIMSLVVNNSISDVIIDTTIEYVGDKFGLGTISESPEQLERHMFFILDQFMKLPEKTRNDLGTDGVLNTATKT